MGADPARARRGRRADRASRLPEHNLLIGGEPGSGKSVVLSSIVAAGALDPSATLTLLDGKQVELAIWRPVVGDGSSGPTSRTRPRRSSSSSPRWTCATSELLEQRRRKLERTTTTRGSRLVVVDELATLPARRHKGTARSIRRGAARPGLARPRRRRDRGRGDPEAEPRRRPHLRARPLQLPHGAALHVAGGLRHDPRAGLGDPGLLGVDDRSRASAASGYLLAEGGIPKRFRAPLLQRRGRRRPRAPRRGAAERSMTRPHQRPRCSPRSRAPGTARTRSCSPARPSTSTTGEIRRSVLRIACKDRRVDRLSELLVPLQDRRVDPRSRLASSAARACPTTSLAHPTVFVTLTAPSFGAVHRGDRPGECHPHARSARCGTAARRGATLATTTQTPCSGAPLCAECFDYEGAVLWNATASRLWHRTMVRLRQGIAATQGLSEIGVLRGRADSTT